MPVPPFVQAAFDQATAAAKEAHGPGHSEEWYEMVGKRLLWYREFDGRMDGCPWKVPDEDAL